MAQTVPYTLVGNFNGYNGNVPNGLVLGPDGAIYGTTARGGASGGDVERGVLFKFSPTPSGASNFGVYTFQRSNWIQPAGNIVIDSAGTIYGLSIEGGDYNYGTFYSIAADYSKLSVLHSFNGFGGASRGTEGGYPAYGLVRGNDGNFYGTTQGNFGEIGSVFKITPAGVLTTLHYFNGADGREPGFLSLGRDGYLYGTTKLGGSDNSCSGGCGTVYKISTSGSFTLLHSFSSTSAGFGPTGGVVQGRDGNFYGTNFNFFFKMTPSGSVTTIGQAGQDTGIPTGPLLLGLDGNFYGYSAYGGSDNDGAIFQVTPSGLFTRIFAFNGPNGFYPDGLIQSRDGYLYGITAGGGIPSSIQECQSRIPQGCGTVFRLELPKGPPAPLGLTAVAKLLNRATLSWTAVTGTISYNVYEGLSETTESSTPIVRGNTTTSVTINKLTRKQKYCFTVAGVKANGVGLPSNEACIVAK